MSEIPETSEALRRALEETRAELARISRELDTERREETLRDSYYINSLDNMLTSLGLCRIIVTPDFKVSHEKNTTKVFGAVPKGTPIAEIFGTEKARRYFDALLELRDQFTRLPQTVEGEPWTEALSSETGKGIPLEEWTGMPAGCWQVRGGRAEVVRDAREPEYYLLCPEELIGPEDDFRIEYTARADADPRDLSVVVGSQPTLDEHEFYIHRPEADGYCFAFGGMGNLSTEIQRRLLSIESTRGTVIQPGKEHQCVAERIGGMLRLTIDGRLILSPTDALPLLGAGRGYVSLYTCSAKHIFWNIRVFTRPTCIPSDLRHRLREMDGMVLEVPKDRGPARFVRVYYIKPGRFLFANVTDVVEERLETEVHERLLQARLARSDKMESIATMAGGVAHDLNNILGPVVGFPALVTEQLDLITAENFAKVAQDIRQDVKAIEWSAHRAAMVVQDLLTLSRKGHYQKKPLSLNSAIRAVLESREVLALRKAKPQIALSTDLPSSLPNVLASDMHLMRVIGNLVRNSFEAMGEEGSLRVATAFRHFDSTVMGQEIIPPGDYLLLTISDTGSGIDEKDQARIFEPFFSTKKRTPHSGTGLGLSVVHGIVKDHGGFIELKSARGKGTTFEIYLPASKELLEPPAQPAEALKVKGGSERVLVVDDAEQQVEVMKKFLRRLGYTCTVARSGREAMEIFGEAKDKGLPDVVDLVLLDMIMEEDFDGLATYQKMLELYPGQKAIIVSGYSPTGRAQEAVRLGAGWLAKPFTIQELAQTIRQKLDA